MTEMTACASSKYRRFRRLPINPFEQVEAAIQGKDCTFSAFVVEAVRVALESLEEE